MLRSPSRPRPRGRPFVLAALLCSAAAAGHASGTYVPAAGGPPRQIRLEDFHLGKALYLGEAAPQAPLEPARLQVQRPVLAAVQQRLPRTASSEVNLPLLAGRLTDEQFDALLYFVRMRFKIAVPAATEGVS